MKSESRIMNSFLLRLSIFPCLGGLMALAGVMIYFDDCLTALGGRREVARVSAMQKIRSADMDLIVGIRHDVSILYMDGREAAFTFVDNVPVGVFPSEAIREGQAPSSMVPLAGSIARADMGALRRIMLRSREKANGERLMRVKKTETAYGWLGLSLSGLLLSVDETGHVRVMGPENDLAPDTVTTEATYYFEAKSGSSDGAASLTFDFKRTINGHAARVERRDFMFWDEPPEVIYRPVFTFKHSGTSHVVVADLGRRGSPLPSFSLFGMAEAAFIAGEEPKALLLAAVKTPEAYSEYLNWFGVFCEGQFTRWGAFLIIIFFAAMLLSVGLIIISLHRLRSGTKLPSAR